MINCLCSSKFRGSTWSEGRIVVQWHCFILGYVRVLTAVSAKTFHSENMWFEMYNKSKMHLCLETATDATVCYCMYWILDCLEYESTTVLVLQGIYNTTVLIQAISYSEYLVQDLCSFQARMQKDPQKSWKTALNWVGSLENQSQWMQ